MRLDLFWKRKTFTEPELPVLGGFLGYQITDEVVFDTRSFLIQDYMSTDQDFVLFELEELILCLHLLDRLVYERLGAKKKVVLDTAGSILAAKVDTDPTLSDALTNTPFLSLLNARQQEYGNYKTLFGKGAVLKGSLLWEASKHFTSNPVRMVRFMQRFVTLHERLSALVNDAFRNLPGTFKTDIQ